MSQSELIDTIRDNEKELRRITEYIENLIDCAESYMRLEPNPDESIELQYKQTLKTMLELESQLHGHIKALRNSQNNPDAIEDERAFNHEYQQIVNESKEVITDDHPKLKQMRKRMWFAGHEGEPFPEEDDDIIMDEVKTFICPLTKQRFVDPVKSKVCGHVFSREAIYNFLQASRKLKCPVAGCSHTFGRDDLEDDFETQHAMDRDAKYQMSEESSDAEIV